MEDCNPSGPFIACDGSAVTGTVTIPSDLLTPCKEYIFWIDGFSGSVCSYYISVTGTWENCQIPQVEDLAIGTNCNTICPSQIPLRIEALVHGGTQINVQGIAYKWEITSPFGVLTFDSQINNTTIPFLQAGSYRICVTTTHPCLGNTPKYCKTIYVEKPTDYDFGTFDICKFPWLGPTDQSGKPLKDKYGNQWAGEPITAQQAEQGYITTVLSNDCFCQYSQSLRVNNIQSLNGREEIALCPTSLPFQYHNFIITNDINNLEYTFPDIKNFKGCDSVVLLNVRVLNMGGIIAEDTVQGGYSLKFNMDTNYIDSDRDSLKYTWKNGAGNVIQDNDSDNSDIFVNSFGQYNLDINVFKYGQHCTFHFYYLLIDNDASPTEVYADNWPIQICKNNNIATFRVLNPHPAIEYIWTYPPDVFKMSEGHGFIQLKWSGRTGGEVCVRGKNANGLGPETCKYIAYIDQSLPEITVDKEVCINQIINLKSDTSLYPGTKYNWHFDGGNIIEGQSDSSGPLKIRWDSAGLKTITLSVIESGCVGETVYALIDVVNHSLPPDVYCQLSTLNSVTFGWSAVVDATDYIVNILSGSGEGIKTEPNLFTVTNIGPGNTVEISVTTVLSGTCKDTITTTMQCATIACALPYITIDSIDVICLTKDVTPIILTYQNIKISPPVSGEGHWIIDNIRSLEDLIDPVALGAGTHTLGYHFDFADGLCSTDATNRALTIQNLPSIQLNHPSVLTWCEDEAVVLTALTEATNVSWSDGIFQSIPFIPERSGIYFVTVTDSVGCRNIDSVFIQLLIKNDSLQAFDDTLYVSGGNEYTINLLSNDLVTYDSIRVLIGKVSSDYVQLIEDDHKGKIKLKVTDRLKEPLVILYELCDQCDNCYKAGLYLLDDYNGEIVLTTLITPLQLSNNTLRFSENPLIDSEIWIYNRWGQVVYHTISYLNDWNADGLLGGVYYYVLKVKGVTYKKSLTVVK
jgi:hypothetical protein